MNSPFISHPTANTINELLHSGNFINHKPQLVKGFTRGRTTNLNQMFKWEAAGLLKWLQGLLVSSQT